MKLIIHYYELIFYKNWFINLIYKIASTKYCQKQFVIPETICLVVNISNKINIKKLINHEKLNGSNVMESKWKVISVIFYFNFLLNNIYLYRIWYISDYH